MKFIFQMSFVSTNLRIVVDVGFNIRINNLVKDDAVRVVVIHKIPELAQQAAKPKTHLRSEQAFSH